MIRVVRTIEYEYDDWETAARDIAMWQMRGSRNTWSPFGKEKRARSRIESADEVEPRPKPA